VAACSRCTNSCAVPQTETGCRCSRSINLDNNNVMTLFPVVRRQIVEQMEDSHLCCKTVEEGAAEVCRLFGEEAPVVFTSGGTENAALISSGTRFPERNRLLGSLLDPLCMLTQPGMEIIGIDDHAYVEAETMRQALLKPGIAAVSLTLVNGEYGIVSPVAALAKLAKVTDPEIFVYVDASQACGRMSLRNIPPEVDAVGISGAKIGALPGTGALWIREPDRLETLMGGGYQQYGVREGSLNMLGIAALTTVLKRSRQRLDEDCAQISALRKRLDEMILNIGGIRLNFEDKALVCNTSNYYIEDIDSRKLCLTLKRLGLKVSESVGGLCDINTITPLTASLDLVPFRNLRFSLSVHNTTRELEHVYRLVSGAIELFRHHNVGTEHVFSI
jgi:cysteine sulfinate desulfinase/cysteine desulfurase-like protein